MNRIAIHPYMTMFGGVNTFLRNGGELSTKEAEALRKHMSSAERLFSYDGGLLVQIRELEGRTKQH